MTLLEDIQAAAIDSNSDLSTILRKCKVLGARLGSSPLEEWLMWEANGYFDNAKVPEYRIWQVALKGHFAGPYGSGIQNAPIPLITVPEKLRSNYESYECRQSIAALEAMLKTGGQIFHIDTGDLSVILGGKVFQRMNCYQAWAECGAGNFIETVNAVRNRILDFTLAVWKESPSAGELSTPAAKRMEPAQVNQIFQTTVYGGSATIVSGGEIQLNQNIKENDVSSVREFLQKQGLSSSDLEELTTALSHEEKPHSKESLGPKVSGWLGKMATKAAEGTLTMGISTAGKLLHEVISKYYGFS